MISTDTPDAVLQKLGGDDSAVFSTDNLKVKKMKSNVMRSSAFLVSIIAASFSTAVWAEYVGPSKPHQALSVAEILKKPVDGQNVVLRGVLLRKVGKEKYIFSDGTGEIRVEIENEDFPDQKTDDKTRLEVRGEVEKDFLESPEIDVKSIKVIQ